MSNRNRMIKNNKYTKRAGFLATAVLTAALIAGQVPVSMTSVNAAQGQETLADVIPDNITISEPTELENITLPGNEYGILEWADGSYVPTKRVESCQVLLTPAEGQDLSHLEGWDEESGQVVGYINVVVADFGDDLADTDEEDPDEDTAEDTTENTDTANKEETDPAEDTQVTVIPEETEDKGESEESSENGEETPDTEDTSAAEQTLLDCDGNEQLAVELNRETRTALANAEHIREQSNQMVEIAEDTYEKLGEYITYMTDTAASMEKMRVTATDTENCERQGGKCIFEG